MRGIAAVVAASTVLALACSETVTDISSSNLEFDQVQFSNVAPSSGNYTAGWVDIVSPFVTPDGNAIRDQYKYEAWRDNPLAPAQGTFHHHTDLTNGNANLRGIVLCFTIVGNRARIGGLVTFSNNPGIPEGSELTWSVADNTDQRKEDVRDTASPMLGADAELYCALGLPYPEAPLEKNKWVIVQQ
jgi:hypothetical protein